MKSQKSTWRRTGRCGWCGAKRKHRRDNYLCDRCEKRKEEQQKVLSGRVPGD